MVKPESLADPLLIKMHVHAVLPSESEVQRPMDLGKKLLPSCTTRKLVPKAWSFSPEVVRVETFLQVCTLSMEGASCFITL